MFIQIFGYSLAVGVVLTSLAMMWMGGRWQAVEAAAYAGERRPAWFWILSLAVIALYLAALVNFISADKSWASWLLIVILPLGWAVKAALVTFNQKGRQTVASVAGDGAWVKIALARLPIAGLLAALAWLA